MAYDLSNTAGLGLGRVTLTLTLTYNIQLHTGESLTGTVQCAWRPQRPAPLASHFAVARLTERPQVAALIKDLRARGQGVGGATCRPAWAGLLGSMLRSTGRPWQAWPWQASPGACVIALQQAVPMLD
jgi:hypothetical protein